jgi:hypothetical protein
VRHGLPASVMKRAQHLSEAIGFKG